MLASITLRRRRVEEEIALNHEKQLHLNCTYIPHHLTGRKSFPKRVTVVILSNQIAGSTLLILNKSRVGISLIENVGFATFEFN